MPGKKQCEATLLELKNEVENSTDDYHLEKICDVTEMRTHKQTNKQKVVPRDTAGCAWHLKMKNWALRYGSLMNFLSWVLAKEFLSADSFSSALQDRL